MVALVWELTRPKHYGNYLHKIFKKYVGNIQLHQTLRNNKEPHFVWINDLHRQNPKQKHHK